MELRSLLIAFSLLLIGCGVSGTPAQTAEPKKDAGGRQEEVDAGGKPPVVANPFNRLPACKRQPNPSGNLTFQAMEVDLGPEAQRTGVAVEIGHINRDVWPDVMIAHSLSNGDVTAPTIVRVLQGTREGLRVAEEGVDVGHDNSPRLLDLNADDLLDIANYEHAVLAESAEAFAYTEKAKMTAGVTGVARWGNLNGDSFPDLLVGTQSAFAIRLGTGDELGQVVEVPHEIDRFGRMLYVGLHDVNGDGYDDVVTVFHELDDADAYPPASLAVYTNRQSGTEFTLAQRLELPDGLNTSSLAFGDFDCNGLADLVTTVPDQSLLELRVQTKDGWGPPTVRPIGPDNSVGSGTQVVSVADVNGDGASDVVVGSSVGVGSPPVLVGTVNVYLGDSSGSLADDRIVLESQTSGFAPQAIGAGDVDGEFGDDIVVINVERDNLVTVWFSRIE